MRYYKAIEPAISETFVLAVGEKSSLHANCLESCPSIGSNSFPYEDDFINENYIQTTKSHFESVYKSAIDLILKHECVV